MSQIGQHEHFYTHKNQQQYQMHHVKCNWFTDINAVSKNKRAVELPGATEQIPVNPLNK